MPATPNTFDYFKQGEPSHLSGTASTTGVDYFRQGEPFVTMIVVAGGAPPPAAVRVRLLPLTGIG